MQNNWPGACLIFKNIKIKQLSRPRILESTSAIALGKKMNEIYQDRDISKINEKILDKEFNYNKYLSDKYQTKISNKKICLVLLI